MAELAAPSPAEASRDQSQEGAWPKPAYAYYVLIMITLVYTFAILDRVAIGLFVEPIKRDLGISDTQMGLLQGLAFALLYTLFGLPAGWLVDRTKRVRLLAFSLMVWSCAAVGSGMAMTFAALFAARMVLGAGEAASTPASTSIISDYFSPKDRPRAFSIYVLGSTIGSALSYLLGAAAIHAANGVRAARVSWASHFYDWQIAFMVIGAPGILIGLLMLLTVREPIRREKAVTAEKTKSSTSFADLWAHVRLNALAYTAVIGGGVLCGIMTAAQMSWFPTLFIRGFGWSAEQFGSIFALLVLPNGIIAALSATWLMNRMIKAGRQDGPILVMLGQLAAWGVFGVAKSLAPTAELSLVFNIFTGVTGIWAISAAITALAQITPNQMRGQMSAVYAILTGLIAYTLGAAIVGLLTDYVFPGTGGIAPALASVFFVCGAAGSLLLLFGRKAYIQAAKRAKAWSN